MGSPADAWLEQLIQNWSQDLKNVSLGMNVGDEITQAPETQRNRFTLCVPGGGAEVALVDAPGQPSGRTSLARRVRRRAWVRDAMAMGC